MRIPLDKLCRASLVVPLRVHAAEGDLSWDLIAAVDTGSITVVTPQRVATLLGYSLEGGVSDRFIAGDSVFHAPRILLTQVDVGVAKARAVEAICHDLPRQSLVEALVGLSFLTRFKVAFDFDARNGTIRSKEPDLRAWEMELAPRA